MFEYVFCLINCAVFQHQCILMAVILADGNALAVIVGLHNSSFTISRFVAPNITTFCDAYKTLNFELIVFTV